MGIQMETGKPGWNDAMNGLPGILGSTMPESYETLRVLKYLKKVIQRYPKQDFEVPTEMHTLMQEVETQLGNYCLTSLESQHITTGKVPSADFCLLGRSEHSTRGLPREHSGTLLWQQAAVEQQSSCCFAGQNGSQDGAWHWESCEVWQRHDSLLLLLQGRDSS